MAQASLCKHVALGHPPARLPSGPASWSRGGGSAAQFGRSSAPCRTAQTGLHGKHGRPGAKVARCQASATKTSLSFQDWMARALNPPRAPRPGVNFLSHYGGRGTETTHPDASYWSHGIEAQALFNARRYLAACLMEEPERAPDTYLEADAALDGLIKAMAVRGFGLELEERPLILMGLARLAAWVPQSEWVRPLSEWEQASAKDLTADEALALLMTHLLEEYPVPAPLRSAVLHADDKMAAVSESAQKVSRAFLRVHAAAGGGGSVHSALQEHVYPGLTKKSTASFSSFDDDELPMSPLHALRRAQMRAMKAAPWVEEAICDSEIGDAILDGGSIDEEGEGVVEVGGGGDVDEEFVTTVMQWVAQNGEDLERPETVVAAANYLLEMRRLNGAGFAVKGRTVKKVLEGLEEYELSTIQFDDDEKFERNPRGIQGMWEEGAVIPKGTEVTVPYDGPYRFDADTEPCLVRISEILSLKRLIYEGQQLGNCLENKYNSQVKYVSRARRRTSSFWSMTFQPGNGEAEFELLIEVWHERGQNVIHQAESNRPRTLPTHRSWYWMDRWCEKEGINLKHWDMYSNFGGGGGYFW